MNNVWLLTLIACGFAGVVVAYLLIKYFVDGRRAAKARSQFQRPQANILPVREEYELSVRRPRISLYHNIPALPQETLSREAAETGPVGTQAPPAAVLARRRKIQRVQRRRQLRHAQRPQQTRHNERPRSLILFLRKQHQKEV